MNNKKIVRIFAIGLFPISGAVWAATVTTTQFFNISDRGAALFQTTGSASSVGVGYGVIQPNAGNTNPNGVAILRLRQNGVLVTEAGVPAVPVTQSGRIYAELNGPVDTGVAMVNPNSTSAVISFNFTDADGTDFGQGNFTLGANQQIAKFIDQAPFTASASFAGTFTFNSSLPIGVVAIRGLTNERGEFLISTQAVTPVSLTGIGPVYFPHFADGGGWTTQVILVNPTDTAMNGDVQFFSQGSAAAAAAPITLKVNGQADSDFTYFIPPRSSVQLRTSDPVNGTQSGSVQVIPAFGGPSPFGSAIFSFTSSGVTVSQATVSAQPAESAFRMYAEASGTPGEINAIETGVAVTNTTINAATVNFELTDNNGVATGLTATAVVPPLGHIAKFLDELFPAITGSFQGVLRITSSGPIVVAGLRTRYNERGDFLITTTPPSNETASPANVQVVFPHLADGGGYTTQFILFSGTLGQAAAGMLRFINQSGVQLPLTFQ